MFAWKKEATNRHTCWEREGDAEPHHVATIFTTDKRTHTIITGGGSFPARGMTLEEAKNEALRLVLQ